jgi:hypothetical protein
MEELERHLDEFAAHFLEGLGLGTDPERPNREVGAYS